MTQDISGLQVRQMFEDFFTWQPEYEPTFKKETWEKTYQTAFKHVVKSQELLAGFFRTGDEILVDMASEELLEADGLLIPLKFVVKEAEVERRRGLARFLIDLGGMLW